MKKKKINFDDLIDRLIICIEKRNPNTILDQTQIDLLRYKWNNKEKQLYSMIKNLEQNEFKAESLTNKVYFKEKEIEFKIGVSLSGEDIIVKHLIQEKTEYEKSKNSKKPPKQKVYQRVLAFMSKTQF